jgi:hypothetical protein
MNRQQQQPLKQDVSISQILRSCGKHFTQIRKRYSDGHNGRCAIGVIMSYHGWNGKDKPGSARRLLAASIQMKHAVIDEGLLIDLKTQGAHLMKSKKDVVTYSFLCYYSN